MEYRDGKVRWTCGRCRRYTAICFRIGGRKQGQGVKCINPDCKAGEYADYEGKRVADVVNACRNLMYADNLRSK